MNYDIKLNSTLSFDDIKEKDLINMMNDLRAKHKLGEFISNVLRVYSEKPELFNKEFSELNKYGVYPYRVDYFNSLKAQVAELKDKINHIYDMAVMQETYVRFNKKLGIAEKAQATLQASFILQRYTQELCEKLGVTSLYPEYTSNQEKMTDKKIEDNLEFIITAYEGIVMEIRQQDLELRNSAYKSIEEKATTPPVFEVAPKEKIPTIVLPNDNDEIDFDSYGSSSYVVEEKEKINANEIPDDISALLAFCE